jgi:hypothetical protein
LSLEKIIIACDTPHLPDNQPCREKNRLTSEVVTYGGENSALQRWQARTVLIWIEPEENHPHLRNDLRGSKRNYDSWGVQFFF